MDKLHEAPFSRHDEMQETLYVRFSLSSQISQLRVDRASLFALLLLHCSSCLTAAPSSSSASSPSSSSSSSDSLGSTVNLGLPEEAAELPRRRADLGRKGGGRRVNWEHYYMAMLCVYSITRVLEVEAKFSSKDAPPTALFSQRQFLLHLRLAKSPALRQETEWE